MPRLSTISRLFFYSAATGMFFWALTRNGPITLNITLPQDVRVAFDTGDHSSPLPPHPVVTPPNTGFITSPQAPPKHKEVVIPEPDSSILRAMASFDGYSSYVADILDSKEARFSRLPQEHESLAHAIGYHNHFSAAKKAADVNSGLFSRISANAAQHYGFTHGESRLKAGNYEIVGDFLGHIVRDWALEGKPERDNIFPPILDALKLETSHIASKIRVLVPGFGLGRLAHEIANDPRYEVDANELDYGSVIAYHHLLNTTRAINQHTIYPFLTKWTHQYTKDSRFAPIRFPDMLPSSPVTLFEGDFLTEFDGMENSYDAIVTLFFIDVSENIIDFLKQIHRLLKPGGVWINLGPVKWGSYSLMHLSIDEILDLANLIGFDVDMNSRKSVETVYGHQPDQLMKFVYITQFWTAKKRA